MPRQFLPTLRGLLAPRTAEPPPSPLETKDLLAGGVLPAGGRRTGRLPEARPGADPPDPLGN